jgi:hypothetical protein
MRVYARRSIFFLSENRPRIQQRPQSVETR